jgi:hypothetical protein
MPLNRAALLAEVDTDLPDNTSGLITPLDLRTVLSDILNNIWTLQDSQTTSGTITFSAIALGLTGILYGNGASAVSALAPGQIPGTATNDSATAGNVGEVVTVIGSPTSLTTGTPASLGSATLSAGDWEVWGDVYFNPGGTTTISQIAAGFSTVNNVLPTPPAGGANFINAALTTGATAALPVGRERYSLAGSTPVYLVAQAGFGVSTMAATGKITARRMR